jgi:pimeloyl-ACP methyl ester carboxylesterase
MVVIGHSYGGFVAACAAQRHRELVAVGLIAPWDISYDARAFAKLTDSQARDRAEDAFNDVDGRLTGADAQSLMATIRNHGTTLDLAAMAPALSGRPLLLAVATHDDPDDQGADLREALKQSSRLTYRLFDTDHGFNDHRIALESFVLDWLAPLSAAPRRPSRL